MALQFYRIMDGVSGAFGSFAPLDIIGIDGPRPATLKHVAEKWPYDPPPNFITVDLRRFEERAVPPVEAVPLAPLTELEVRKRYKLQDPEFWTLARQCGFPAPRLKRTLRERRGDEERSMMIDLWQQPDVDHWIEKMQQLAPLIQSVRLG